MSATTTLQKDKAVLDTFQLFYEELPLTLNISDAKRTPRLQRRSKQ